MKLIWSTRNGEKLLTYMARVSNPNAQLDDLPKKLIKYLIDHRHWSPFEMIGACFEINTTRDIARQILRHRSFSFQEFSQRYGVVEGSEHSLRECRLQDKSNRQHSLPNTDKGLDEWWKAAQQSVIELTDRVYNDALAAGLAREQARVVLPEGLTPTKMYMAGSLRSWLHYIGVRTTEDTQKEHRDIAKSIAGSLLSIYPQTREALKEL